METVVTALSGVDTIWVLLGAALVFFMQAGFAMVETGFTRAKNAGNIIMKNLMDFSTGTIAFWVIGFGLMFAGTGGFIGGFDFLIQGDYGNGAYPTYAFVIFQTVFCATAATIVSGAMAERTKFSSYLIYSIAISAVVYPISGHWIWGGGWLAEMGFHDFAGSTAVHMVGGVAALVGAKVLGPRIGKYCKSGKVHAIPGHSLTLGALGVFILWFCWFGFNGCSTVSMTGDAAIESAASIFVTTNLSAATAAVAVMCLTWVRYKKPDVSMTLNGALAGLVGITAGCDMVSPVGAFFIGLITSIIMVFGIEFVEKTLKIDDPVGAIGVHGISGAVGTILTGLFALEGGVFYGGGWSFFGVQVLGVAAVIAWVLVTMTIIFVTIKKTVGLRVSEEEEVLGLDIKEHGLTSSYADFMIAPAGVAVTAPVVAPSVAVPVVDNSQPDAKMTKVVVLTKQEKFQALKDTLDHMGVTGMTVTQVLGCGMQRGGQEYYRGVSVESTLIAKVKVEIIICKVPVDTLIDAIKKALYTGHVGDGKIFVYDVENVVKIRTGEQGYDALQDE